MEVQRALGALTERLVAGVELRARLDARLAMLFPDGIDPADVPPPLLTHRISLALGVPDESALRLTLAACYYYSAADLADDLVDAPPPEPERSLGINDVCALLFLQGEAVLEIESPRALEVARLFLRCGLVMAAGQLADLSHTDDASPDLDAVAIARGKTGGELSALVAAPALLLGLEPAPYLAFGSHMGTLLQILTDYMDLFAKEQSDDFTAGKATLPLVRFRGHPTHGSVAGLLLSGARRAVSRQQAARWLMIEGGSAAEWRVFADGELEAMERARAAAGRPAILGELLEEMRDLSFAVDDAFEALSEGPSEAPMGGVTAPELETARNEIEACRRAAAGFLRADPDGEEATETHRWGLFGRDVVVANLFGQLVAAEHLAAAGLDARRLGELGLSRMDEGGFRYFPGCPEIPPDADLTGLALQVAVRVKGIGGGLRGATVAQLELLRAHLELDGTIPTWLGASSVNWTGAHCPASMANAVMGWHRAVAPGVRDADLARATTRLAAWLCEPETPGSAFYSPPVVEALGLLALVEAGADAHPEALATLIARLSRRRRLSGLYGSVLESGFAVVALASAAALPAPEVAARALVDAQMADGGFEACPFYLTMGPYLEPGLYSSRLVTTAVVLRALRAAEAP